MDFKTNKPIYMQIVDLCFGKILTGEWKDDERIPSVRELGASLQVNPNTAMRAFEYMQAEDVIYIKRGMGYYVQKNARKQIVKLQKEEFFKDVLPEAFRTMLLLNIDINEIVEKYESYKNEQS
ncbi:GntR family transcriptional regulator [Dysgonomonas sp. PH5-45]|uniref:GntR family transcriptional regulator n=1 Tax=unclassified Dysgonomonas TaxID=2630389 RepID=UPI0024751ACD|nr:MULTISPECIES: GntR family transcriptional regulator [unclassified Dysgonomonas]MDH6355735.1 GntR family transcriptional regulator [Dysgonomonas sp. PH5-45]MDH6388632.1 GntR family transcriptional regulator [Dysgonomonas sp. PH5-37]